MSATQILDLDIGNSFLKWRHGESEGQLATAGLVVSDLIAACAVPPERIRLASVASNQQVDRLVRDLRDVWGVQAEIARTSASVAGVVNSYQQPERMGVDRWLAMVAAFNQFSRPCCVVDCGSAITVDYVDAKGLHQGGYIMPGARLLRQGLLQNTERVYASQESAAWSHKGPGSSTDEAVSQGIGLMLESLAQRIAGHYRQVLGERAVLVICGGDGRAFQQLLGAGELRPSLVLDGLAYVLP